MKAAGKNKGLSDRNEPRRDDQRLQSSKQKDGHPLTVEELRKRPDFPADIEGMYRVQDVLRVKKNADL